MGVAAMNHFTVLSNDLEATRRFYCDLFGFKVGWRPPGGSMRMTTRRSCM
jgi:catechol 2,3-dioxygenase-like lactoylglutathione lyase family enzyme